MKTYNKINQIISEKGAAYVILIDPDELPNEKLPRFLSECQKNEVDALLVGGSLMFRTDFDAYLKEIKSNVSIPVIIFPGGVEQVSPYADALLYISIISGRNAEHLIGKHVIAAPKIKQCGIEPISTGYMLIESGKKTTAEYMSGSSPIPRNKPEIAVATALAAEYMGMKFIYLEAGSGAEHHVPFEMVSAVAQNCSVPVIVGGGIREPQTASKFVAAGAKIIVTGNHFEDEKNWDKIRTFADAVHIKKSILI